MLGYIYGLKCHQNPIMGKSEADPDNFLNIFEHFDPEQQSNSVKNEFWVSWRRSVVNNNFWAIFLVQQSQNSPKLAFVRDQNHQTTAFV